MEMKDLLRDTELLAEIVSAVRAAGAKKPAQNGVGSATGSREGAAGSRESAERLVSPAAALLSSLKPFLKPRRRERAETLIKVLSAAELCRSLRDSRV